MLELNNLSYIDFLILKLLAKWRGHV